ncbi:MAG: NADP-dependent phosphogluconate dehydrogenase [Flavisolibacter sp.]|nr:NADP-dependent phosphogluconate dehydrogenase [Flavisolibacter sp.]
MENQLFDIGIIGMGVMGRNLLLNMADHGFKGLGHDKSAEKIAALESDATPGAVVKGVSSLAEFVKLLEVPRKIMLLVPAGKPVDDVIESLIPLLEKGDIIIDGGNSYYKDTVRRDAYLRDKGLRFLGVGVSGGEEGARTGPSMMPGGDENAYHYMQPLLEAISAKVNNVPCVGYLGKHGAGHFVKMVHNGIEYGIMQLISEAYDLLHQGLELNNDELAALFDKWNKGDMTSYLIEITAEIFTFDDERTGSRLVDMILDKAGSKGTGKWTSQEALDLGVPIPTIDMAVTMRNLSSFKEERASAAFLYKSGKKKIEQDRETFISQVHDALYFATLISYIQGLAMLQAASKMLAMEIPMPKVVKVWRGGCIIRSTMLDIFSQAYEQDPSMANLLLDSNIASILQSKADSLRKIVSVSAQNGYPSATFMSSLSYYDAYLSDRLPTNLIQAQRDYFGAHTYQRIDEPETSFHTEWMSNKVTG